MLVNRLFFVLAVLFVADLSANEPKSLFLEAKSFTNQGGWVVDQQFMDLLGSPYLMAHGLCVPVEDAVT